MKIILTTTGQEVLVSDIDYEYLNNYHWYYMKNHGRVARNVPETTTEEISRTIARRMGLNLTKEIDHKDRNALNNQRENLRESDRITNNINRGMQSNNTTGYKGVTWHKYNQRWRAVTSYNNKQIHIGYYETAKEAAKAYNRAVYNLYKEFAVLNIIEE
jgi:hypothetical protein